MSNTSNNSGNSIYIGAGGGGGGNIVFTPGQTQWITVNFPQQIVIESIDLAVPVEEKKKDNGGCKCKKCKEFFEYAEPNQKDGTLICWSCRHGY